MNIKEAAEGQRVIDRRVNGRGGGFLVTGEVMGSVGVSPSVKVQWDHPDPDKFRGGHVEWVPCQDLALEA